MNPTTRWCLPATLALATAMAAFCPVPTFAQTAVEATPDAAAESAEEKYAKTITERAEKIVAGLNLADAGQRDTVRDALVGFYRDLRAVHDPRDAAIKAIKGSGEPDAQKNEKVNAEREAAVAKLTPIREAFVAKLTSAGLTPQQVDGVKDGLTYNVLNVTTKAFDEMIPTLTEPQRTYIREQLTEARELAMLGGSNDEKHGVFGKYKGRINNYLSKEGYDLKQETKNWAERRKAATTKPAA